MQLRPQEKIVVNAKLSLFLTAIFMLVSGRLSGEAQANCDAQWGNVIRWQGKFTLSVTGSGDFFGNVIYVNNFATATFDENLLLGTLTFTNDFGNVNHSLTASCAPTPGEEIQAVLGKGRLTSDTTINIVPQTGTCTYSLSLVEFILTDFTIQLCDSSIEDFGTASDSPSLGQLLAESQLQNLPLPPFGQPLAGQITSSISYSSVPLTLTFSWNITPLGILITNVQTPTFVVTNVPKLHTFISSDPITNTAVVSPAVANVPVEWTVSGTKAAMGIAGFPQKEIHNTDSSGVSTFVFTPANNAAFVSDRSSRWTNGSTSPNLPIGFDVVAGLEQGGITSTLSQLNLGLLEQDETDTERQEYKDYLIPVPKREEFVANLGGHFNRGPYPIQLSVDLTTHYNAILNAYRGSVITVSGQQVRIPVTADMIITTGGGFRNPQVNKAARSKFPDSRHTRGRALDLQPIVFDVVVNTQRTTVDLHATIYPALASAIRSQGLSVIAEKGAADLTPGARNLPPLIPPGQGVGDTREDHLHTQW